jgi:uncharacterized protein
MGYTGDLNINRLDPSAGYDSRSIYRNSVSIKDKYFYRLRYKYTDIFITSDRDILKELEEPVTSFYSGIEGIISHDRTFMKSLEPVKEKQYYPGYIKKMCQASYRFGVGPMAAVAGAVCDRIAEKISGKCGFLMIENGGDVFIKSKKPVRIGLFSYNSFFSDRLNIVIGAKQTPCGICSSSGTMGHSLNLGKSDLVTVMAESATMADAAATAVANSVLENADIGRSVRLYKKYKEVKGIIIIKDDRIGIWGNLQLVKSDNNLRP